MNELTHYGVKGMHWGVRRYDYVPKGRKRSNKSDKEKEKFHLSEKQKKALLIGGATVGTLIAVYGAYKLGSKDMLGDIGLRGASSLNRLIRNNKGAGDFLNNIDDLSIATGFSKNKEPVSILKSTAKVNPGYSIGNVEYRNNCFSAVTADLLNRTNNGNGLDVVARPATSQEIARGGMSFNKLLDNFQGADISDIIVKKDDLANAKQSLANQIVGKTNGQDGFGIIRVSKNGNSSIGHYIKWEVQDGQCTFSDSLSGTIEGADKYFSAMGNQISRSIEFSRVDGLAVNPFTIGNIVTTRK